jgi:hypothetical protein
VCGSRRDAVDRLWTIGRAHSQDSAGLATIVDRYLDEFARRHPSIAAGNGLHGHDDTLEDFSAGAVKAEVEWLRSDARQPGGCRSGAAHARRPASIAESCSA